MSYTPHTAKPRPRRRGGRLRPLTLADRRAKAERNDRRGRDRAHVPGVDRKARVGKVGKTQYDNAVRVERTVTEILAGLLARAGKR